MTSLRGGVTTKQSQVTNSEIPSAVPRNDKLIRERVTFIEINPRKDYDGLPMRFLHCIRNDNYDVSAREGNDRSSLKIPTSSF